MKAIGSRKKALAAPIAVRLEEEHHLAVLEVAAERKLEVSELLREYVIQGLREDIAKASVFEVLALLKMEVHEARKDIALVAEVALSSAGKLDEKEAVQWVQENLCGDYGLSPSAQKSSSGRASDDLKALGGQPG